MADENAELKRTALTLRADIEFDRGLIASMRDLRGSLGEDDIQRSVDIAAERIAAKARAADILDGLAKLPASILLSLGALPDAPRKGGVL